MSESESRHGERVATTTARPEERGPGSREERAHGTPRTEPVFVIVGASLAGAKAAQTLRDEGFGGSVVLIGEEPHRPYERPPLSKGYLLGKDERDSVFVHPPEWYAEHDVRLRTGTPVVGIDRPAHEVELSGGERVRYDKLLLTTGSVPRRLDVPGADLDGVRYLRRLEDADRLLAALTGGGRVVVVGGGWIGLEVAAAARERGAEVALVEVLEQPLQRVLGPESGAIFAGLHRQHGVDLRLGSGVREIRGGAGGAGGAGKSNTAGRVAAVVLADGSELPADTVVAAVGVRPATALAEAAGLAVADGVVVDEALRTADPDIYAAGDVASAYHPLIGSRIRVEHWANALNGGPAAARSMLGQPVVYDRIPYFFSDQYDVGLEYSGWAPPGSYDQVVFRGDVPGREFIAFWLAGGRLLAGMNVNMWDVTEPIQALVRAAVPVEVDKLADPGVPLADLVG